MSRMSVRAFLSRANTNLAQALKPNSSQHTSFVIGNESADLDSITCALVYSYIQSSTPAARKGNHSVVPVTHVPRSDLPLRPELTALLKHADLNPNNLITLDQLVDTETSLSPENTDWVLVDHNSLQGKLAPSFSGRVCGVIDHHEDENAVHAAAVPRVVTKSGSCSSLVVNYLRPLWDDISDSASSTGAALGQGDGAIDDAAYTSNWDAQVAKLALGAILIDTVNLKAKDKVTDHDTKAVKYLEAKINSSRNLGRSYDRDAFFNQINDAKSDLDPLSLKDILRKDYKQWTEKDLTLGISSCVKSIDYLRTKEKDMAAILLEFARERKVDIYAIMTAHNDSKSFSRQLLLMSVNGGEGEKVVADFKRTNAEELQLNESEVDVKSSMRDSHMHIWEQQNLAASRKQVAPMLRRSFAFNPILAVPTLNFVVASYASINKRKRGILYSSITSITTYKGG